MRRPPLIEGIRRPEEAVLGRAMLAKVGLYIRTIRYLRAQQVVGQVRSRLRRLIGRPRIAASRVPEVPRNAWVDCEPGGFAAGAPLDPDRVRKGVFFFLNREGNLGWPIDWSATGQSKLWQYQLHDFGWIWSLDVETGWSMARDWIARHPLARDQVGWEPYPLSLRVANWLGFFCLYHSERWREDGRLRRQLWASLYDQAWWLDRRLETHLLGNHLFENAATLTLIGSCFPCEATRRWLDRGSRILSREIEEQVLADGMHFERSPMYHVRMVRVMIRLVLFGHPSIAGRWRAPLGRMLEALTRLLHGDGEIALFNDSAMGMYGSPATLLRLGWEALNRRGESRTRPSGTDPAKAGRGTTYQGSWSLKDAGYFGYRDPTAMTVICDAGSIGPDYLPGHAHGDIFSYEISLRDHRVIVDSGVYSYEKGAMRDYCRSTRAHNTVEINGQDQCELWGVFRVARRGYPREVKFSPSERGFELSAWHDGYRRLAGRPLHYRRFRFVANSALSVYDRVEARRGVSLVSRIHLHPDSEVFQTDALSFVISVPTGRLSLGFEGKGRVSLGESRYCPEFGRRVRNTVIEYRDEGRNTESSYHLRILKE